MTNHTYYSIRTGSNPAKDGLTLNNLKKLFKLLYNNMKQNGYFDESFYAYDDRKPKIPNVEFEIFLKISKENLWPINEFIEDYSQDDLFDIIEFLYIHVSKPISGVWDNYWQINYWNEFDKAEGQKKFREKINEVLGKYIGKFEISKDGEILEKPEIGLEEIFKAGIPSNDEKVTQKIKSAVRQYRRHGATLDDRRHAVRNLANNFGIRHHNEKQKTDYDAALWLSWMFYFYLATIHLLVRKIENTKT